METGKRALLIPAYCDGPIHRLIGGDTATRITPNFLRNLWDCTRCCRMQGYLEDKLIYRITRLHFALIAAPYDVVAKPRSWFSA